MDNETYLVVLLIIENSQKAMDAVYDVGAVDVDTVYGDYGETTYEDAREIADVLVQTAKGI